MHLARHLAEAPEPGEELRGSAPDLRDRELPAVLPVAHELLENPERRVQRAAGVRVPAAERRDVREAALGEEAQRLELGVDARLEPAEDLEDELVVEDERRVRLLAAHGSRLLQLAAEPGEPFDRPELDGAVRSLQRQPAPHRVHELARRRRIVEPVDLRLAVHELVDVVRAGLVAHLHELEREARLGRAQLDRIEHLRVRDSPRLRAIPPLLRDVLDHRLLVESH